MHLAGAQPVGWRDERLAIVVSIVVLTAALSALIALPSRDLVFDLFGSELSLSFSGPVQVVILLVALVCAGVDGLVQRPYPATDSTVEPGFQTVGREASRPFGYRAAFYSLPTTLSVIGLVAVHSVEWWGYQIAAAASLGLVLTAVIRMQLATHTVDTRGRRTVRLALNALSYALALGLFGLIFGLRLRSLVSATGISVVSGLIALELYRNSETSARRIWLYAALTALLMGQLTWALNYTPYDTRTGSALLLLAFYTLTGLAQQSLWERLTRRIVGEYAVVLAAGISVVIILL
jgi:hypothetical protein